MSQIDHANSVVRQSHQLHNSYIQNHTQTVKQLARSTQLITDLFALSAQISSNFPKDHYRRHFN